MSSNGDVLKINFEGDIPMARPSSDTLMPEVGNILIKLPDDIAPLEEAHIATNLGDNDLVDVKAFKGLVHEQDTVGSNFAKLNAIMTNLTDMVTNYFAK